MNKTDLLTALYDRCTITGTFALRSGKTTDVYFDKYRFETDPLLLGEVARQLVPLIPSDIEVLAGLEMGGIPLVTAMSLASGLPAAFVRKVPKPYGTRKLVEGTQIADRNVLVVEDVITTGGQVATSAQEMRELGARVDKAICVVNRSGHETLCCRTQELV